MLPSGHSPRHLSERVGIALQDTPAVLVNGPRQCGKTTLVRQFEHGMTYTPWTTRPVFTDRLCQSAGFAPDRR